ncbi:hypothetical protein AVEN_25501-1 [Araneus ventricosus]|uniref:Uncharacterized protein n=1 Tax=Araneus ventricosus TaxID=182803 RepID=A0A4Y2CU79_ARAVE|nr:hypothetical protein AVEN_25501-1 [Araneus ventricosus]
MSKVFESVLLKRLNQFLDDNDIIISEQFGFRKQLSTNHQLVRVTELINDGFAKSESTGALFLDVAKAFHKILPDGLLLKIMKLGISAQLIKIFSSYHASRNFQIIHHCSLSNCIFLGKPMKNKKNLQLQPQKYKRKKNKSRGKKRQDPRANRPWGPAAGTTPTTRLPHHKRIQKVTENDSRYRRPRPHSAKKPTRTKMAKK